MAQSIQQAGTHGVGAGVENSYLIWKLQTERASLGLECAFEMCFEAHTLQ